MNTISGAPGSFGVPASGSDSLRVDGRVAGAGTDGRGSGSPHNSTRHGKSQLFRPTGAPTTTSKPNSLPRKVCVHTSCASSLFACGVATGVDSVISTMLLRLHCRPQPGQSQSVHQQRRQSCSKAALRMPCSTNGLQQSCSCAFECGCGSTASSRRSFRTR